MTATQPRPGSLVSVRTAPPSRTVPVGTGNWFVAGMSDRGPLSPVMIRSLQEFVNNFGGRQTYSSLYDAMETYFREGGGAAYISRVVGPAAAVATKNLNDAGAAVSLVATAKGPGTYGNSITIAVQNPGAGGTAGSFSLLVTDPNYPGGSLSEQSPDFTTQAGAVAWAQNSALINLALGASANLPANAAASALAGGADDRNNIVDANWATALTRFTRDLGPGQVTQLGRTTAQAYTDTLAHAQLNNRVAILDAPDSPTVGTVTNAATFQRGANDIYGALFAPWVVIPGLTPNTTRIVPPSALVAAKISHSDASGFSPNTPAAGNPEGVASFVIGLSQVPYDNGQGQAVTRDSMYSLGVNQIVYRFGVYEVFGWRTLTDPNGANQDWLNLGNRRLAMAVTAEALAIAERYTLSEIDPQGRLFKRFQGDLSALCARYYDLGSLFGSRPEDAYIVDVGPTVNTLQTIANKELHAAIALRMSQDAELVVIEITKVPVNQAIAA
jgi:hypothetical protein